MTQFFDTHAHYDSGKFNTDRDEVLRAVHDSGVAEIKGMTIDQVAEVTLQNGKKLFDL